MSHEDMNSDVHELIEKIVEVEWIGTIPRIFFDPSLPNDKQGTHFKITSIQEGLIYLRRDVSQETHGPGPHEAAWVPLSSIKALWIAR